MGAEATTRLVHFQKEPQKKGVAPGEDAQVSDDVGFSYWVGLFFCKAMHMPLSIDGGTMEVVDSMVVCAECFVVTVVPINIH